MKKIIILLTSILLTCSAYSVEHVKPGDTVVKEGFIFTTDEEKELRANDQRRKLLEALSVKYEDKMELQEYRLDLYKEYTKDTRPMTKWQKVGYFAIGVLTTSAALYMASKINKNLD